MAVNKDLLKLIQQKIHFILVGTSHSGNIGAAARAMKNMGINKLMLVAPKEFPHKKAFFRAKAATDVLENATIHKTLSEAVADFRLVVGTSARNRKVPWPIVNPREVTEEVISFCQTDLDKIAIVFGREDRGLTNEELGLCNLHVYIPSSEEYPSLNLSQAVQIIAYEIRLKALTQEKKLRKQKWDVPLAKNGEIEKLIEHFEELMQEIEFYEVDNPRQLLKRVRRFFKRTRLDHMEANIFRGVMAAIQKKLKR
tara:strand:- start:518 stop:1279 length:762 start_codon:yes stop_codon:yes gene_type:complete